MKRFFILSLLIGTVFLLPNCKKDHQTDPDDPADSTATGNNGDYGSFTFTARGEDVTCDAGENSAVFVHDFHGVNYLTVSGINRDEPEYHESSVSIDVILQGELAKGTYQFTGAGPFYDCLDQNQGCDKICVGEVLPEGDINYDTKAANKALQATGGTLKITSFSIGEYINGFAEGHISGTFNFSGSELGQFGQYPGSASGKFDDIPLLVEE